MNFRTRTFIIVFEVDRGLRVQLPQMNVLGSAPRCPPIIGACYLGIIFYLSCFIDTQFLDLVKESGSYNFLILSLPNSLIFLKSVRLSQYQCGNLLSSSPILPICINTCLFHSSPGDRVSSFTHLFWIFYHEESIKFQSPTHIWVWKSSVLGIEFFD